MKFGNLNFLEPSGPLQACNGTALPLLYSFLLHSHILACLNIARPDGKYPKLKVYISELILYSHEFIPVTLVTMRCMIMY